MTTLVKGVPAVPVLTDKVAVLLNVLHNPLTMTAYVPASLKAVAEITNELLVCPPITVPFFVHT